jgi:opacity protein-like surface antigen
MVVAPAAGALAADYFPPPPPPAGHAWYLKGYLGMTNQGYEGLESPDFDVPAYFEWLEPGNFDAGPLFGLGIGVDGAGAFRFDVTGEYRGKVSFSALDRYDTLGDGDLPLFDGTPGADWGTNEYTARKSEWLFLANGYLDLGTWNVFNPFIGAGIGASRNTISDFLDNNVLAGGQGYATTAHKWNLAWALHAGAGIHVNDRVTIDVQYSFVHLGDAVTGPFVNVDPNIACLTPGCPPMTFNDLYSHDLKLGVRWMIGG